MVCSTAKLKSGGGYTVFEFGGRVIRFKAPHSLERYIEVKHWDGGYLVVTAKYSHNDAPEEEYIDLLPVLSDLYINARDFLEPIRKVEISYE